MGPIPDEVAESNVVEMLGAAAHARAVAQLKTSALWVFFRDVQHLLSPYPLELLGVHHRAGIT